MSVSSFQHVKKVTSMCFCIPVKYSAGFYSYGRKLNNVDSFSSLCFVYRVKIDLVCDLLINISPFGMSVLLFN